MASSVVSFCKKDIMSVCTACNGVEQENCVYYEKSRIRNRCMYFIFDEYCDCLKAQMNATNKDYLQIFQGFENFFARSLSIE